MARKDDEADWEEAPAPHRRSERRRLASVVSVRFAPREVDELRRRATRMGMTMSGYLRWRALDPPASFSNYSPVTTLTVAGPVIVHYPDEASA